MKRKVFEFIDKLYFGFRMYGKNYYSDNFSNDYGIILLLSCNAVILMPTIGYLISLFLPKYNLTDISVYLLFAIIGLTILFLHLIYFNNSRIKKISDKYRQLDLYQIKKIKRMSGHFAVFSFIWCIISVIILFIIS